MRRNFSFVGACVILFVGCSAAPPVGGVARAGAGAFLFAWVTDGDSVDLNILAVIDAREASSTCGEVVGSLAMPTRGRTRGHHVEHFMPASGRLFANDFGTGMT